MTYINLTKIILYLTIIMSLSIIDKTTLYGMKLDSDEEKKLLPHSTPKQPLSTDELLITGEKKPFTQVENLHSLQDDKTPDTFHKISHYYMSAFQNISDESNGKFLAFKYISSLGIGFGAGIPLVGAALKAGAYYGSSGLGYYLASSTILCTGGIASWMIWDLIDNAQDVINGSRQPSDNSLVNHKRRIKGIVIGALSIILGGLSTAPEVYSAYKYNEIKEMAIVSFVYEIIPRTLGFYKFISSINSKIENRGSSEETVIKEEGREIIDLTKMYFLKLSKEKGTENIASLVEQDTPNKVYSFLSTYAHQDLEEHEREILPQYYAKGVPRKVTQYSSLIFPIANACVNTVLTYKGYNLITDNLFLLVPLTTISVLPILVLNGYGTIEVSGGLFDKIYSARHGIASSDFFGTFYPKIKTMFIAGSIILATSASGSGIYIILDNLEGTFLSSTKYLFITLAITSSITFGSYAITSTLTNYGEVIVKHFRKSTSYVFNCLKKLENIKNRIVNYSTELIKEFIGEVKKESILLEGEDLVY